MPLPLLALAAIPAAAKVGLGLYQMFQHVKRQDTTTPEEREMLGMARQANAAQLPGLAQYQARLAQTQNATLQNARLGSGSASDYLAAASAADRVRNNGEQQLGMQGEQFHQQASSRLTQQLAALAAHGRADTDRAAQENAQLKGAGLNNISNGLTEGASVATYGALQGGGAGGSGTNAFDASSVQMAPALQNSPYPAGDVYGQMNPYRRRSTMYGGYLV